MGRRVMFCKSGHSVGKAVITGTTIAPGGSDRKNLTSMKVVLGDRNKGMDGINSAATLHNSRILRFGNNGSLVACGCRIENTSEDRTSKVPRSLSSRILRAYFRKRVHSSVVGIV